MLARHACRFVPAFALLLVAVVLVIAVLADAALAQQFGLPGARLYSIYPAGAKAGTTVDVTIDGADLDDANKLHFSVPQITAAQKMGEPELGQTGPQPQEGKFTITIPPDVAPGIYEVRAIGKYGISNPRAFVVGADAEIIETEPNNDPKKATEIAQGSIINGRADGNTDLDFFKFAAKAGQRIIVDCWAYRIDSRMDATLVLFDAGGRELARNRDTNRRDPLLDYRIPADGEYFVQVYDFLYGGGSDYTYRLCVSTRPYIDFILPPAGPPAAQGQFSLFGRNLPGGSPAQNVLLDGKQLDSLAVTISTPSGEAAQQLAVNSLIEPSESGIDGFEYRLTAPEGMSNPVLLTLATSPVVLEQEPNNDPAKAPVLTVPCEYAGQFYPRGDTDWVQYQAKKGETYWIEVLSERLGVPSDPFVLVQQITKDEKGMETAKEVEAVDDIGGRQRGRRPGGRGQGDLTFDTSTEDAVTNFTAAEDGLYRVMIKDQFGTSKADPRKLYRLSIRTAQPDFRLVAVPRFSPASQDQGQNQPTVWSTFLRKGGSELIDVHLFRRDGFEGDVEVSIEGLPAGVTAPPITIGGSQQAGSLVITAAESAAETIALLKVVGKAKIGDALVARTARTGTMVSGGQQNQVLPRSRLSRNLALAVSGAEPAPFSISTGENLVVEMSRAGTVKLPVQVARRGEFKGNIALMASGLPQNVQPKNMNIDGGAAAGTFEIALQQNAPEGTYTFFLVGTSQHNYARNPESAKAAEERKAAVDKAVADLTAVKKTADDAKTAAEQAANTATANAQKATEAQKAAEQALTNEQNNLKAAEQKLKEAEDALGKDAANQGLVAARDQAKKTVEETTGKVKTVTDAKAAADKAATDAAALAKTAMDAKTAAEKAAQEAMAKLQQAQNFQQQFNQKVNQIKQQANAQNRNIGAPSTAVTLKITPAPITMAITPAAFTVKQGAKFEIPVTINRLYGFADAVPLRAKAPDGVSGLNFPQAAIPQGQNQGPLVVEVGATATPGAHKLAIQAVPKFNNQDLSVLQDVTLTVEKVEPAK